MDVWCKGVPTTGSPAFQKIIDYAGTEFISVSGADSDNDGSFGQVVVRLSSGAYDHILDADDVLLTDGRNHLTYSYQVLNGADPANLQGTVTLVLNGPVDGEESACRQQAEHGFVFDPRGEGVLMGTVVFGEAEDVGAALADGDVIHVEIILSNEGLQHGADVLRAPEVVGRLDGTGHEAGEFNERRFLGLATLAPEHPTGCQRLGLRARPGPVGERWQRARGFLFENANGELGQLRDQ